jgi:hypothetical protein
MEHIIEILHNLWYGPDVVGLQQGVVFTGAALGGLISAGGSLLGGIIGGSAKRRQARAAAKEKQRLAKKLESLENNRQAIINPYDQVEDLSSMITNPYENLGVATQAAEMQSEQADISLANTLDLLASTGASAGGATALAQAALQSKKGVSASIEQQEAQNEQLRARGELMQTQALISEQQRLQSAGVAGEQFMFGAREEREMQQLDRISTQLSGAEAREAQARADQTGIMTTAIGGIASGLGSFGAGGGFAATNTGAFNDFSSLNTFNNTPSLVGSTPIPSVGYQNTSFNPSTYFPK